MKNVKTIFCLISLLVAGITNVWGDIYTHDYNENIKGSYNTSTHTLTITGTGAIPNCTDGNNYYGGYNSDITKIIIGEGITGIGRYVFDEYTNVTSITFPSTLTSIATNNFGNSKKIVDIHASSPNQWAQVTITATSGHPFGTIGGVDSEVKAARGFYFNGSNKKSRALIFTQGLDSVRQYTFYNARYFTSAYIPGSVSRINSSSLTCLFDTVVVNKMDRPILANATTISFNNPSVLIVPTGATNFTEAKYWLYSTAVGKNSSGARSKNEQNVSGTVDGQDWSLSTSGVLTINGSGALSTSFVTSSGASQYPYYYFRYLVDKVVVTGGITALSNILQRCEAMKEIDINQAKVPTASSTLPSLIHGGSITFMVNPLALGDASASNLASTPWTDAKFGDLTLSDDVTVDETDYNAGTMLRNIHKYVKKNINLKFVRAKMENTYFNTFCSPIPLSAEEVRSIFGEADIRTLTSSSYDEESQTLTLNFSDPATPITTIDSGVPYLIQPEKEVDFSTITFENIAPQKVVTSAKKVTGDHVNFYGTLGKVSVTAGQIANASFLFLLADNKLTYATEGSLRGMRAYFILNPSVPAGALAHRPVLNLGDEQTPTAIDKTQTEVKAEKVMENGVMYIIKNGVKYSVMGERVR